MDNYSIELLKYEHGPAFFKLMDDNRQRLEDFFAGTVKYTNTLEDTLEYCKLINKRIQEKSYFPYLIIENKSQKIAGFLDVKNIDWTIPKAELGAFADTSFEGKGIISRCTNQLIDEIVATHGFKKLLCRASSRNTRSINVILNAGFELEGTIRRDYKTTKGELVDLNYYGKLF